MGAQTNPLFRPQLMKVEDTYPMSRSLTPLLVDQILHLALWARALPGSFRKGGGVQNCLIFTKAFINHNNNTVQLGNTSNVSRNLTAYSNKTVDDKKYLIHVNSKHGDIVLTGIAKIDLPIQFSNSITVDIFYKMQRTIFFFCRNDVEARASVRTPSYAPARRFLPVTFIPL